MGDFLHALDHAEVCCVAACLRCSPRPSSRLRGAAGGQCCRSDLPWLCAGLRVLSAAALLPCCHVPPTSAAARQAAELRQPAARAKRKAEAESERAWSMRAELPLNRLSVTLQSMPLGQCGITTLIPRVQRTWCCRAQSMQLLQPSMDPHFCPIAIRAWKSCFLARRLLSAI